MLKCLRFELGLQQALGSNVTNAAQSLLLSLSNFQLGYLQSLEQREESLAIIKSEHFSDYLLGMLQLGSRSSLPPQLLGNAITVLSDLIMKDPAPPIVFNHFFDNGLIKTAWQHISNPTLCHDSDTVIAMLNLVESVGITEKGVETIKAINPFPAILRIYHDTRSLNPHDALLTHANDTLPFDIGDRLFGILSSTSSLTSLCINAVVNEMQVIADLSDAWIREANASDFRPKTLESQSTLAINKGDLKIFYFAIGILKCFESMMENKHVPAEFIKCGGLQPLFRLLCASLGSNAYLLSSLACTTDYDCYREDEGDTSDAPGFPVLTNAFFCVAEKLIESGNGDVVYQQLLLFILLHQVLTMPSN